MGKQTPQRSELVATLQQSVRRFADEVDLYQAAAADRLGMHATDLKYLGYVAGYGPTTAGHLAELGGLTTGAVTGVLDRLEGAGYVRRESDPEDRRKVVVRVVPGAAERVEALYRPMLASTDPLWDRYSDDELAVVLDFADRAQPLVSEGTAWLRAEGGKERAPRSTPEVPAELRAPIAGLAEATLRLTKGVGHLRIRGAAGLPDLFRGTFPSNPPTIRVDRGVVSVHFRRSPFGWRPQPGDLALTDAVRWRLEVTGGVSRTVAELQDLDVRSVNLTGGVSHASIGLPAPRGVVPVHVTGGVNDLTVLRPAGTAARLRIRGGASNVHFDGRRFSALGRDASWSSTDGDQPDQYEIEISGGARTVSVTTV